LDILTNRRSSKRAWLVFGVGDAESDGKMTTYAVCEPNGRGRVRSRSHRVAPLEIGPNSTSAKCPEGRKLISGGFAWFGTDGSVYASRPKGGRTWKVSFEAFEPTDADSFLKAYAYCV
jgi:hypothetical protein